MPVPRGAGAIIIAMLLLRASAASTTGPTGRPCHRSPSAVENSARSPSKTSPPDIRRSPPALQPRHSPGHARRVPATLLAMTKGALPPSALADRPEPAQKQRQVGNIDRPIAVQVAVFIAGPASSEVAE